MTSQTHAAPQPCTICGRCEHVLYYPHGKDWQGYCMQGYCMGCAVEVCEEKKRRQMGDDE